MRYPLQAEPGFAESLDGKTLEELTAMQDELSAQRRAILAKARAVADLRNRLVRIEDAAAHGLTPDEYDTVKATARESGKPLRSLLKAARKGAAKQRALQVVKAGAAAVGTETKGA